MSTDIDSKELYDRFIESTAQLNTVVDWLRYSISQMQQQDVYFGHGTDNIWDEAVRLVFCAVELPLELPEKQFQVLMQAKVTADESAVLREWLFKRAFLQVPLPYITNTAWFAQRPFFVDERVLIPRSPYAELIEKKFQPFLSEQFHPEHILDMCTGSACIAIALAMEFEQATVDAVDIDNDALDVASINVSNYHLEDRVYPLQSDVFEGLAGQKYDLIVANPPYVDAEDMADLPEEYLHEPEHALASGQDGLDLTVRIMQDAASYLNDGGWLFVEVGNSEVNFATRFDDIEVNWCNLEKGGSGIFAISKEMLVAQSRKIKNLK